MNTSVLYFATVTLLPCMYKGNLEAQYEATYKEIFRICKDMSSTCSIIAESTKNYNIHYHLLICFKNYKVRTNLRKMFIDKFRNNELFGFVNITQVEDLNGVVQYCLKEYKQTTKDLNAPSIICDELHLFPENDFGSIYIRHDIIDEQ